MIEYHYELPFELEDERVYSNWITRVVEGEGQRIAQLSYVFCNDKYLLELNQKFLKHNTLTDILTFPYEDANGLKGEIYISVERVRDNANQLRVELNEELRRVMIHGVLHLLGYDDQSEADKLRMRNIEDSKLKMFHVEQ
ncbi:MAG: rRNA maturation RNase YbeY [Eudoraea sp.]|nr:rRNA maturation RNase YbeY [Eudoraea sp.]